MEPKKDVRRALWRRMIAELKRAVRGATEDQILEAVAARTASESIAQVLVAAPGAAGEVDDWAEELLRGAAHKQELIAAAGGVYTTGQVAKLLDRSVPTIQQRLRRKALLGLPLTHGEWGFPVCQFTDAGVPDALGRVLRAFGEIDPWVQLSVLLSDDYGDRRLIDWIRDGRRIDDVERIARSYGTQGAA